MTPANRSRRVPPLAAAFFLAVCLFRPALGNGQADSLFKRLPADASMVLAVEDLRGHAREILASPFYKLPAIAAFQGSEAARRLAVARKQIEATVGAPIEEIRDKIFGNAVILCLHAPGDRSLDEAHGLLLIQPSDPVLLAKIIKLFNAIQTAKGELDAIETTTYRDVTISVRKLKGKHPRRDYYVVLDGGILAWSNSESLIQGVVDRSTPGSQSTSLADRVEFQELRKGLPARSFVSLLISPGVLTRLIQLAPAPAKEEEKRTRAIVERLLKGLKAVGFALEWRNGPLLHSHEVLDPKQAEDWMKAWAERAGRADSLVRKIPRQSLAFVGGSVDFVAFYQGARSVLLDDELSRLGLVETTLQGLLLGRDPRTQVLPSLGPGVVAYVEPASGAEGFKLELIAAIELAAGQGNAPMARAIENAVRTILALYSLDPKHQALKLKVETFNQGGRRITKVVGGPTPFVFAMTPDSIVFGTSAESVARFGDGGADEGLAPLRQAYFPEARWYGVADLSRLAELARTHRASLLKRFKDAGDLDQAIAILDLFPTGLAAMTIDPEFRSVHRVVGLIGAPVQPR